MSNQTDQNLLTLHWQWEAVLRSNHSRSYGERRSTDSSFRPKTAAHKVRFPLGLLVQWTHLQSRIGTSYRLHYSTIFRLGGSLQVNTQTKVVHRVRKYTKNMSIKRPVLALLHFFYAIRNVLDKCCQHSSTQFKWVSIDLHRRIANAWDHHLMYDERSVPWILSSVFRFNLTVSWTPKVS